MASVVNVSVVGLRSRRSGVLAAALLAMTALCRDASAEEPPYGDPPQESTAAPEAQAAAPTIIVPQPAAPPAIEPEPPNLALPTQVSRRVRLRENLVIDATISGALAALLITWVAAIKPNLHVPSCTICDGPNGKVNALDDFFRTAFRLPSGSPAGTISDVFGYGVGPLTGIGLGIFVAAHDHRVDEAAENILLVTEATLTYAVLQQSLVTLIPRERPGVHAEPEAERQMSLQHHSSLESFPAGHNGLSFCVAAAGGTIATMRGYRLAPVVWIVGGVIGFATTYLRLAADRHYFTDLSAGAALGIGTGIAIPLLFHRPVGAPPSAAARLLRGAQVSTTEVRGGRVFGLAWRL